MNEQALDRRLETNTPPAGNQKMIFMLLEVILMLKSINA